MATYTLEDVFSGKTMTADYDPNDPNTFFSPAGRAAENAGTEGSHPGWTEARYFGDRGEYEAFKKTGLGIDDYFAQTPNVWWDGLSQDEKETEIYRAGQRIQHTYLGSASRDGEAISYYTVSGRGRREAEKRLGKSEGEQY